MSLYYGNDKARPYSGVPTRTLKRLVAAGVAYAQDVQAEIDRREAKKETN